MKILVITSRLPFPPHRGDKIRTWNMIREMARHHEITLLSFIQRPEELNFLADLKAVCTDVHIVELPAWKSWLNCIVGFFTRNPVQVSYFRSTEMNRAVKAVVERSKPDLVFTHLIRMIPYSVTISSIPKIVDSTDAVSLYLERFMKYQKNPFLKWLLKIELDRVVEFEKQLSLFDSTLVCSDIDRDVLRKNSDGARVDVVYNGVRARQNSVPHAAKAIPPRIIFGGNMSYYPNEDAAIYFVKEIFPKIREGFPGVLAYIVGQNPTRQVRSLAAADVVVTGFVEDIATEYQISAIAVSPMRFGSGTQYKILEAMSLEVPVVTTTLGISGLDLKAGEEILIADDAGDFAAAVLRLLRDNTLAAKIAKAGRNRVLEKYEWRMIGDSLEKLYSTVVNDYNGMKEL